MHKTKLSIEDLVLLHAARVQQADLTYVEIDRLKRTWIWCHACRRWVDSDPCGHLAR